MLSQGFYYKVHKSIPKSNTKQIEKRDKNQKSEPQQCATL